MEKIGLYIRFQLGNSFGNISGKEKSTYIFVFKWAIHLGIYVERESPLIYSFSIGPYSREYISGKKNGLYIRFQLFGNI